MKKPTRDELLARYAKGEPVAFMRIDGFSGVPQEDVMCPDKDGDSVLHGMTFELMSGAYDVRVLISRGTDAPTAERLLTKILHGVTLYGLDDEGVEVEHILHENGCAIRHHTVGVTCDCDAAGWFEIMPRKDYEAMLPPAEVSEEEAFANSDAHFGVCPECKKTDGYLNLRSDHYFVCHQHRGYWYAGSNLFSQWKEEPSAVHEKNRKLLETYTLVEPFLPPAATNGIAPSLTKMADSGFIGDTEELPF